MTIDAMSKMSAEERAERRRKQAELTEELKSAGALDEVFARIDAGEPLTGEGGVLGGMLKAALERGLEAEGSAPSLVDTQCLQCSGRCSGKPDQMSPIRAAVPSMRWR